MLRTEYDVDNSFTFGEKSIMSERIGWIGLGELGYPMAANLLESGYRLSAYNRTRSKAESLARRGARIASDPLEVAAKGGLVVSVLWTPRPRRVS